MIESSISDNESSYRTEYLRRKNRLAAGRVKGYYRYHDQNDPQITSEGQETSLNFEPSTHIVRQKPFQPNSSSNNNEIVFVQEPSSKESHKVGGGGFGASENMVGYYNIAACHGSIRTARATADQTPPKVTLDHSDLTPLDRIPAQLTDSTTSLLSSSSFRISENSAFTPVPRSASVERFDANTKAATIGSPPTTTAEPHHTTFVIRNINGTQQSKPIPLENEQLDNNNNQKFDHSVVWPKTTSSTMRDETTIKLRNDYPMFTDHSMKYDQGCNTMDNLAISRFARKDLFSPNKTFAKPDYGNQHQLNGPRLLQQANSTMAATNKRGDSYNTMTLPGVMRSALRTHKMEPVTNGIKSSFEPSKVIITSPKSEESSTAIHQSFPKRVPKKLFVDHQFESNNKIEPLHKIETTAADKRVDNLSRWQTEQLEYKKLRKLHNQQQQQIPMNLVQDNFMNQERRESYGNNVTNKFISFQEPSSDIKKFDNHHFNVHPSEPTIFFQPNKDASQPTRIAYEQNEQTRKSNHQQHGIASNNLVEKPSLTVERGSFISEITFQPLDRRDSTRTADEEVAVDVLKSGNVGAKTKLFETLAHHEKTDVEEQSPNKTPNHSSRRKTERSKTIHTTFRRPLTPDNEEDTFFSVEPSAKLATDAPVVLNSATDETRISKNQTPPSSSEEIFEDEKSKLTLSEKAKFFEIKSQESKNRAKRFQQRHKTQPVTQQHRSRSRTRKEEVVKARTILERNADSDEHQCFEDEGSYKTSVNKNLAPNYVSETKDRSVSGSRISNISVDRIDSKGPVIIKPRRTVYLHTDSNGLRSLSQNDSDENSIANDNNVASKSLDEYTNGDKKSFVIHNEDYKSFIPNRLIIKIHHNNLICDSIDYEDKVENVDLERSHKIGGTRSFNENNLKHGNDDYCDNDTSNIHTFNFYSLPTARKTFPPLLEDAFNSLRESEL